MHMNGTKLGTSLQMQHAPLTTSTQAWYVVPFLPPAGGGPPRADIALPGCPLPWLSCSLRSSSEFCDGSAGVLADELAEPDDEDDDEDADLPVLPRVLFELAEPDDEDDGEDAGLPGLPDFFPLRPDGFDAGFSGV